MFVQEWIPAFAGMTAVYLQFHKANETHPFDYTVSGESGIFETCEVF